MACCLVFSQLKFPTGSETARFMRTHRATHPSRFIDTKHIDPMIQNAYGLTNLNMTLLTFNIHESDIRL